MVPGTARDPVQESCTSQPPCWENQGPSHHPSTSLTVLWLPSTPSSQWAVAADRSQWGTKSWRLQRVQLPQREETPPAPQPWLPRPRVKGQDRAGVCAGSSPALPPPAPGAAAAAQMKLGQASPGRWGMPLRPDASAFPPVPSLDPVFGSGSSQLSQRLPGRR